MSKSSNLEFKPAVLPSGEINDTRWREYPTPKRERDGYTIAQYKYDSRRGGWGDPYYFVFFNSMHLSHDKQQYQTLSDAIEAARAHKAGTMRHSTGNCGT